MKNIWDLIIIKYQHIQSQENVYFASEHTHWLWRKVIWPWSSSGPRASPTLGFPTLFHLQLRVGPFVVVVQSLSHIRCCDPMNHMAYQARILEWVASSFSRGSSWIRDRTPVSCIDRWIPHHWATRETHRSLYFHPKGEWHSVENISGLCEGEQGHVLSS